jgi:hypothetical protein
MTNSPSQGLLEQMMIENRISNIATELNIDSSQACMRLVYALLFNTRFDDPDYDTDLVDGGGDKQIDIIRIEETQDQATIHLVQVKNSAGYSGTVVVQMRDGLSWIFLRPEDQYSQLPNRDLVSKIREIRDLSGRLGLRNLAIHVHYVAKGDISRLSPDFEHEVQITKNEFADSEEFKEFEFKIWGVKELVSRFYEVQQGKKRIDVDLQIYYTPTVSAYLQYRVTTIKAVICTVNGSEIARIVNQHSPYLFEENVRTYLGAKKINKAILKTCTNELEFRIFLVFQ